MITRRVLAGSLVLAISALVAAPLALAQSPRGEAEATVGGAKVTIEYGRPSLQGRDMLAQATDGMVWRLGADQSTTLTTSADLDFAGTSIPAGSYSLFARKGADGWTLLVNSQTGQWGTAHDGSLDIAEIPLSQHEGQFREQFTVVIHGSGGNGMLHFEWGSQVLMAIFTVG